MDQAVDEIALAPRAPGRPRRPEVDEVVMQATLELLRGLSYSNLSIEMVARRAKVGKPTIYRRWPSKLELVADLCVRIGYIGPVDIAEGEDLRTYLRTTMVGAYRRLIDEGLGHVVPSVIAEMTLHPEIYESFRAKTVGPRREAVVCGLLRAIDEGLLRPDADVDLMYSLFVGVLFFRMLDGGDPLEEAEANVIFDTIWDLFSAQSNERRRRRRTG